MDKTALVSEVAELFRLNGHSVETSVKINHREIDVVARELQGLFPKTFLIECADYTSTVGVQKMQEDIDKLLAARRELGEAAVITHVSRLGYTSEASGLALSEGVSFSKIDNLRANLVNFGPYIRFVRSEPLKATVTKEYQPTHVSHEGGVRAGESSSRALEFLEKWRLGTDPYLIVLGDYGVGKSWMLRRYLYELIECYAADPLTNPLPYFVPLQQFTKAFDFENLILKTFATYGLSGAHYQAFMHLVRAGRVVLLLDSFDEMAQHLDRATVRANLNEIFKATSGAARFVMTSRPNYFDNKAERILMVDRFYGSSSHQLDIIQVDVEQQLSEAVGDHLDTARFARLHDLSDDQRRALFKVVLEGRGAALATLDGMMERFRSLKQLSQRAVIARLLTTVAETLADTRRAENFEGQPLVPDDLATLSESKIFEIIVYNLLHRDQGVGTLSARERMAFLRRLAVYLQRKGGDPFASPDEIRQIVREVFATNLAHTDAPEQQLESYYRICRRHSGLTTEGQFHDTSGVIDLPVSDTDLDSRIGFSHNSLREYLVSEHILLAAKTWEQTVVGQVLQIAMTDQVYRFLSETCQAQVTALEQVAHAYRESNDPRLAELVFPALWNIIKEAPDRIGEVLGQPPLFRSLDLSLYNLHGMRLNGAEFSGCLLQETDLTHCVLDAATFSSSILDRTKLDGASVKGAKFRQADITSIYAYDEYVSDTSAILLGHAAKQWLFSRGGDVDETGMNIYLGKPWYNASREVIRTILKKPFGTHQAASLSKGTPTRDRGLADEFVAYLLKNGILQRIGKSQYGGFIVKAVPEELPMLASFGERGEIGVSLAMFFRRYTQ